MILRILILILRLFFVIKIPFRDKTGGDIALFRPPEHDRARPFPVGIDGFCV
jgi:hypothetical protein